MQDAVDTMIRVFDRLGWPGLMVALTLTFSYSFIPTIQAGQRELLAEVGILRENYTTMRYVLEDTIRHTAGDHPDLLNKLIEQLRMSDTKAYVLTNDAL